MKAFIDIRTSFDHGSEVLEAMARRPLSDRPAFREIAERLGASIEKHFFSTRADSEETSERKGWGPIKRSTGRGSHHGTTGSNPATMFSSGNTFAHLQQRSTDVSAAVKRGNMEWYLFLHDRGKGYAYWTVDNRVARVERKGKRAKKGSRSMTSREGQRGRERNSGSVTFPQRRVMFIDPADEAWAIDRITQAVDDSLQRTADGSAV